MNIPIQNSARISEEVQKDFNNSNIQSNKVKTDDRCQVVRNLLAALQKSRPRLFGK